MKVWYPNAWFFGYQIGDSRCGYWTVDIFIIPGLAFRFKKTKKGF